MDISSKILWQVQTREYYIPMFICDKVLSQESVYVYGDTYWQRIVNFYLFVATKATIFEWQYSI